MAIPRNLANIAPHANASSTEFVINDGSADLDFRVESDGNANMLFVDAGNNRVGIGTGSPGVQLDVKGTSTTGQIRFAGSGSIVNRLYGDDDGIVILSADVNNAAAGSYMAFQVDGTERAQINASGNVQLSGNLGLGGTTPTTSGTGITFPATQSASSNANTLDDYEEGTWTPATAISSLTTAYAIYTKIGRFVCLAFDITIAANASVTGISITGVPFAANSSGSFTGTLIADNFNVLNVNPFINAATTTVGFMISSTTGGGRNTVAYSQVNASGVLRAVVCYMTD